MNYLLYVIAVILIIVWAVSFFAYHVSGGLIHILLVLAVIAIVWRLLSGRSAV